MDVWRNVECCPSVANCYNTCVHVCMCVQRQRERYSSLCVCVCVCVSHTHTHTHTHTARTHAHRPSRGLEKSASRMRTAKVLSVICPSKRRDFGSCACRTSSKAASCTVTSSPHTPVTCIYVCHRVYVCEHVCMYACMYACMYVCMYHMHVYIIHMYVTKKKNLERVERRL